MKRAIRLCKVPAQLILKLTVNSLEDEACQAIMVLPEDERVSLEQIMAQMEGLFGENMTMNKLRRRLFILWKQEGKSFTHFAVTLQKLWKRLEKKVLQGCTDIQNVLQVSCYGPIHWRGEC